jgi:hypothetical protein
MRRIGCNLMSTTSPTIAAVGPVKKLESIASFAGRFVAPGALRTSGTEASALGANQVRRSVSES